MSKDQSTTGKEHCLCQLQVLGLSCFGCCGHSYRSKDEIVQAILRNTNELQQLGRDPEKFNARANQNELRAAGVCKNVVFLSEDVVGCPLHPFQNNGKEFRDEFCDIGHSCKTKKEFDAWNPEIREQFIEFLKKKHDEGRLDFIDYSLGIDSGKLLKEFMKS